MSLKNPYNSATEYKQSVAWNRGVVDVLEELVSQATVSAGACEVNPAHSWEGLRGGADALAVLRAARRVLSEQMDAA